jgi:histidinol dehydrogenase
LRIETIDREEKIAEFIDALRRGARQRERQEGPEIADAVLRILQDVRRRGDAALIEYTQAFDGCDLSEVGLEVSRAETAELAGKVSQEVREALELAAARIRQYHRLQAAGLTKKWEFCDGGLEVESTTVPISKVGVYVPGGRASYPSTVLMTVVPARIAGVEEVILCTPPANGASLMPELAAAAEVAGVDRIFRVGGAQAIAAMAYGTESIPAVDIVVGPGNVYVTVAKRLVFGEVGIDSLAGPSELAMVLGERCDLEAAALDLLTQAEHGPGGVTVAIVPSLSVAEQLREAVRENLERFPREGLRETLEAGGGIAVCPDLEVAVKLVDWMAPEHLQIDLGSIAESQKFSLAVRNAGAVFVGAATPAVYGDYIAGPSHVLPTGGSARFASALGVHTFLLVRNRITATGDHIDPSVARAAVTIARTEGLQCHERAVAYRMSGQEGN